jgi:hypothetical protein
VTFAFFLATPFLPDAGAFRLEAGVELDAFDEGPVEENPFSPRDASNFWLSAMIFKRSCSLIYRPMQKAILV